MKTTGAAGRKENKRKNRSFITITTFDIFFKNAPRYCLKKQRKTMPE
jgi:hypothetical protein